MNREEKIKNEIDKTINAVNNLPELEPNPFLFTRIQAELKKPGKEISSSLAGGILKPAALFLFVLLNIFSSYYIITSNADTATYRQTYLSAISTEYNMNQTYNSQLDNLMGE